MRDLYDFEDDKPPLGQGSYGVVIKTTHKQTGQHFACKILYVNRASTNSAKEITKLHSEVSIMRELDHPHIVRLREVFYARCVGACMRPSYEATTRLTHPYLPSTPPLPSTTASAST